MEQNLRNDESFALDRDAAVTALPGLKPLLERLNTDALYYAKSLPSTSRELAAGAIDDWDDGDGEVNFVQALLMRQILADQLKPQSQAGNFDLKQDDVAQVIIRHGSLHVGGSLGLHAMLMVLGDLHAKDRVMDWVRASRLSVTGNLTCKTLRIGSPFWVAGNVDAEAVCFDPGGKLWVGGELRSKIVIGCQQSAGVTAGGISVTHYSPSSEWQEAPETAFAKLKRILVPEALATANREKKTSYFYPQDLLELIEAGKAYLR